jgi:hypothetical protein
VGTILGFVLLVLGAAVATFLGVMLVFVSDSCGSGVECQTGLIVSGMAVTAIGPWVVVLAAVVMAVIRRRRKKRALWVPWIGIVITALVAAAGVATAFAGAGPGFW